MELSGYLKEKYPTAHHGPMPGCPRCKGEGERYIQSRWRPCMCLFVEHEHLPLVSELFSEFITQEKAKVRLAHDIPIQVDPTLPEGTIKMGDVTIAGIKEES